MFEKFTDRARKIMQLANQEAQRFNHEYIDTEHILLGLVKEGSGVGSVALKEAGIDLRKVRLEVEKLVQSGPRMITQGKLPQTPQAKRVIEFAMEEARGLRHDYVGTEHILLGLLRQPRSVATQVLQQLGLQLEVLRDDLLNLLGNETRPFREPNVGETIRRRSRRRLPTQGRRHDLVEVANGYPPFVGRDVELTELCSCLQRGWRNSVLLVGEPGGGRTALVERLATEIHNGSNAFPYECKILDCGASAYVSSHLEKLKANREMLFIRHLHDLLPVDAGIQVIAGMLRHQMDRGLRVIATTTKDGAAAIERTSELAGQFHHLAIPSVDRETTLRIAKSRAEYYRYQFDVQYDDAAIAAAYDASEQHGAQFYPQHIQPALTLDVLEHCAAGVKQQREVEGTGQSTPVSLTFEHIQESVRRRCESSSE